MKDASGQLIIDQDEENLSDKEMYARNVPAIGEWVQMYMWRDAKWNKWNVAEITRDSPSEFDQYTDEDYDLRRRNKYYKKRNRYGKETYSASTKSEVRVKTELDNVTKK